MGLGSLVFLGLNSKYGDILSGRVSLLNTMSTMYKLYTISIYILLILRRNDSSRAF